MNIHLYFSLIPEALIASNLPPEKFGQYYSTGNSYKSKGQSMFFEVDPNFRSEYFDIETARARCVPNAQGRPKHSVYISVYRVLEHLPVGALGKLYLTTAYGHTIGIDQGNEIPRDAEYSLHLYQDLVPANSLVVSNLDPRNFYESVTIHPEKFIRFPGLFFVELELGELARDPENGRVGDLPYSFIHHLREALLELKPPTGTAPSTKQTKLVHRVHSLEFPYRMVKRGFYVGNGNDMAFYPMPSHRELRDNHSKWWHSANL